MKVTKWNPFAEMALLSDNLNKMFNKFFDEGLITPRRSIFGDERSEGTWSPDVDIYEDKDSIVVKADLNFTLPLRVDSSKIKAKYKDGILEIILPKPEEVKGKEIKVDVE